MFWSIFSKFYNICSKKNNSSTIIKPKNLDFYDNNYNKSLKIVSYNIDGLFAHYNYTNYLNISKYIRNLFLNNEIDIICLQELWSKDIYNLIINNLQDLNLYISQPPTNLKYCIGEHSGLLTISKFPIIECDYQKYNNLNFTCNFTNKGLQYILIKNYNNEYIPIINTHLQSSYCKYKLDYQQNAIQQLNSIKNYLQDKNIFNCLILGDLNLDENNINNFLNDNNNFIIPYDYQKSITFSNNNELLDYFLFYNYIFNNKIIDFKIHNDIFYSDHFPISLKISSKKYNLRNKIKVEHID